MRRYQLNMYTKLLSQTFSLCICIAIGLFSPRVMGETSRKPKVAVFDFQWCGTRQVRSDAGLLSQFAHQRLVSEMSEHFEIKQLARKDFQHFKFKCGEPELKLRGALSRLGALLQVEGIVVGSVVQRYLVVEGKQRQGEIFVALVEADSKGAGVLRSNLKSNIASLPLTRERKLSQAILDWVQQLLR